MLAAERDGLCTEAGLPVVTDDLVPRLESILFMAIFIVVFIVSAPVRSPLRSANTHPAEWTLQLIKGCFEFEGDILRAGDKVTLPLLGGGETFGWLLALALVFRAPFQGARLPQQPPLPTSPIGSSASYHQLRYWEPTEFSAAPRGLLGTGWSGSLILVPALTGDEVSQDSGLAMSGLKGEAFSSPGTGLFLLEDLTIVTEISRHKVLLEWNT